MNEPPDVVTVSTSVDRVQARAGDVAGGQPGEIDLVGRHRRAAADIEARDRAAEPDQQIARDVGEIQRPLTAVEGDRRPRGDRAVELENRAARIGDVEPGGGSQDGALDPQCPVGRLIAAGARDRADQGARAENKAACGDRDAVGRAQRAAANQDIPAGDRHRSGLTAGIGDRQLVAADTQRRHAVAERQRADRLADIQGRCVGPEDGNVRSIGAGARHAARRPIARRRPIAGHPEIPRKRGHAVTLPLPRPDPIAANSAAETAAPTLVKSAG